MGVDVKFAAAGDDVVITGSNWAPNTTVDIYLNGTFVTTADVGPNGTFRVTIKIPDGTPPGPVEVTVEGLDDPCQETRILGQTITVTSGGARSAGDLPFTGADISVWMVVLAGLLVVGGSLALISRRREHRARR
jgi:LPXTG-motif cell wall-anchored protein